MAVQPVNKYDNESIFAVPGQNTAMPLQNVKSAKELITDSSIISLTSVAVAITDKKSYDGEAGLPKLPSPSDGKSSPTIEPAAQNLVTGFISKQITMLLSDVTSPEDRTDIFNHLTKGFTLSKPELGALSTQIKESVENSVQQEAGLKQFTLTALYQPKSEAWVKTPVEPYSEAQKTEIRQFFQQQRELVLKEFALTNPGAATADEMALLETAMKGGTVDPRVRHLVTQLDQKAIAEVSIKYGLVLGWSPTTQEVDKWRPINKTLINPASLGKAREAMLTENTDEVTMNYLDAILDVLAKYSQFLSGKLLRDVNDLIGNIEIKKETIKMRGELSDAKLEEVLKSQKLAKNLGVFSEVMLYVGIGVSVLSAIATVLTFGAASPIAVAAVTVTLAAGTYTIVDHFTGMTSAAFTEINDAFNDLTSSWPDPLATMVKTYVVVAAAAMLVIAAVLLAPAAGPAVAGEAATAVTQITAAAVAQGMQVAARQLAIQIALIAVMGSGVLTELPKDLLEATGMDQDKAQALQMVIFVLEMLAVMLVAAKATSSISQSATPASATQAADSLSTATKAQAAAKNIKQSLQSTKEAAGNYAEFIIESIRNPKATGSSIADSIKRFGEAFSYLDELGKPTIVNGVEQAAVFPVKQQALILIDRVLKLFNTTTNVVSSSGKAVYSSQMYETTMDLSILEEEEAQLKAILAFLDDVIKRLQGVTASDTEFNTEIQDMFSGIISATSASTNKLFNTLQG